MVDVKREGSGFETLNLRLKDLKGYEGRTGVFEDAAYPDGTKVAYVTAIQELGSPEQNVPPRPFFRPAMKFNENKWRAFAGQMAKRILGNKTTAHDAMEGLASLAAEDIKQEIASVYSPKLKPETIKARQRRGNTSDKPLIDTKLMIRSIEGRSVKE